MLGASTANMKLAGGLGTVVGFRPPFYENRGPEAVQMVNARTAWSHKIACNGHWVGVNEMALGVRR